MNWFNLAQPQLPMSEALSISITGIIVVMLILALLAVLVLLLSKGVRAVEAKAKKNGSAESTVSDNTAVAPIPAPVVSNASSGNLVLENTDDKTAAVIMAIVSNESGIPLNRLQFNSIKLIEK